MLDLWAEGVDLWAAVVDLSDGGAGGAGGGRRCWSSGRRPPSSASAPVSSWTPSSSTSSATPPRRLTTRPCSPVLPVVLVYFARSGSSTGSAAPTASEGSTTAMAVLRRRERDVEADLNLPPGFWFHPTDDELVEHYLCRKAAGQRLPVSIIAVRAVATRNGQIKLFGRDNTQALLQSPSPIPSKFLRFAGGQGVLLNVNTQNQIEVWDIDTKKLCYLHPFEKQITMLTVLHKSFYM